jgi:catechol 2,3-dioxygenase-like lactoylglutathione lyase family enzyme
MALHHVDLRVSNFDRSERFYDALLLPLGFCKTGVEGETVAYYVQGPSAIGIRPARPGDGEYHHRRAGLHHLAISVGSRKEVDQIYSRLVESCVRILEAPREYPRYAEGYYALFFLDPDGIRLEILHWPGSDRGQGAE